MMEQKFGIELIELLQELIRIPSYSGMEDKTADLLQKYLQSSGTDVHRKYNNIWARNAYYNISKPTILLNSHHDTVKPANSYKRDPYDGQIEDRRIYGLGSNDAGASVVCLLGVFLQLQHKRDLPWNLIYAATAEEEISGKKGIESIIEDLGPVDLAIIGEPTSMKLAIAEKGLLVLECFYEGISGHAGRLEGDNAIYKALDDIGWFRTYKFPKVSGLLGPVQMQVTQIEAGKNHNVVPDLCKVVVDVRCTDSYTLEETLAIIEENTKGRIVPRSVRLRPSFLNQGHPVIASAKKIGLAVYGSPTLSDQALIPYPSVKIGPGDTNRSHMSDEYILLSEIHEAMDIYQRLLKNLQLSKKKDSIYETLE